MPSGGKFLQSTHVHRVSEFIRIVQARDDDSLLTLQVFRIFSVFWHIFVLHRHEVS